MNAEILAEWNPWWEQKPAFELVEREVQQEILSWVKRKEIVALLGVRRSGKTSLLYLLIEYLLQSVDPKNIFFIKCDDDRVEKSNLVAKALELYKELRNPKGKLYIFIDEIQETEGWEHTLKRLYDLEKDMKFLISGSNFSMLKEDLSYKLAGRLAHFEIYPFSFRELLKLHIPIPHGLSLFAKKQEIKHVLRQYIEFGGFPEVVLEKDRKKKQQLLQFYYDTIVYRDIIKRRKIRNPTKMEKMINYFLQNISSPANFSKVGKQMLLSVDSIGEYVKYLQDAFFLFSISLFSFSVKKQEINPKKMYCVDTGIRNAKGFRFSQDAGRLAENIVFVEIKRQHCMHPLIEVFYWQQKHEIDFVVKDGAAVKQLIQVCWNIDNPEVKKREVQALLDGMQNFHLNKGLIITEDTEGEERIGGKRIQYIPFWKWLLQYEGS